MPSIDVGRGITLYYEVHEPDPGAPAPPDDRPVLLVQGLAGQLISWDDEFVRAFTSRGSRTIVFDNRDVGLSTFLDGEGMPDLGAVMGGDPAAAPYTLADMAADAAGLLDALDIDAAHVLGVSMGGMIVQRLSIDVPERVASLCSIMSTTGNRSVGMPTPEGLSVIFSPPPQDAEAAMESAVATWRILWGSAHPFDEEMVRRRAAALFTRCNRPDGVARQVAAIVAASDRSAELGGLDVPALVVHGDEDPLIGISGGEATAAAIPGARFIRLAGVGHSLPPPVWGEVVGAVYENASRAA